MYISIFFGIFTIYLPYIQNWEKPSRHFSINKDIKIDYAFMINKVISRKDFPQNNVIITLPGTMNDPSLRISHRFVKPIVFNPYTKKEIKDEDKQSHLAKFLNELHYMQPIKYIGVLLFGILAIGVMLTTITGVMLIFIFKFKNKGNSQQSFFSKMHIKLFTWVFPFFLLITLSGAFMNFGLATSSPMAFILSGGESKAIDKIVGPILFPKPEIVKKAKIKTKMLNINVLIQKASTINNNINFQEIKLVNWGDKNAQIELKGYNPYMPFLNGGIFNKPSVTLNASTGKLIKNQKVLSRQWSVYFAEATFFLHFLFGVDLISRTFIAFLMFGSAFAISFGVMLWLEKKAKKFDNKITFYHWMGKLSLSIIIGVIPATALLFNLQWLLPFDLQDRVLWQQGVFYNSWLATLFWSFYRINSYQAAKEFLFFGGLLFITATLFHFIFSGFNPLRLLNNGLYDILGVDIVFLTLGIILIYVSVKLPKNRSEAKIFFSNKNFQLKA